MLVLKRKESQWVEVVHVSGDVLRIRVCRITSGTPGHLDLVFDDDGRRFSIERPERRERVYPGSETARDAAAIAGSGAAR